jgi:hypothetical protein
MQTLAEAGFKGDGLRTAWAIAMRESGGNPQAFNGNASTGDKSYGLFQVNMLGAMGPSRMRQYGLSSENQLFDPTTNARVAYQMSKGGTDFGAWGIGPNAYQGAPAAAHARFEQLYNQFPGAEGLNRPGSPAGQTGSVGSPSMQQGAPSLAQHVVTSKVDLLSKPLAIELASQAQAVQGGSASLKDLGNLFTLAKGYLGGGRKAAPMGGTQLARNAGNISGDVATNAVKQIQSLGGRAS